MMSRCFVVGLGLAGGSAYVLAVAQDGSLSVLSTTEAAVSLLWTQEQGLAAVVAAHFCDLPSADDKSSSQERLDAYSRFFSRNDRSVACRVPVPASAPCKTLSL